LEPVAQLAVSDDELRARGVPMFERAVEEGLGELREWARKYEAERETNRT